MRSLRSGAQRTSCLRPGCRARQSSLQDCSPWWILGGRNDFYPGGRAVLFSRAVGERCGRICLCLIKAGGDCFGGQRREVNAGQIAWRAVKEVAQITEAALTDCDVKVLVPACSRRLSGTAEEERRQARLGARCCLLAAGQVPNSSAAGSA